MYDPNKVNPKVVAAGGGAGVGYAAAQIVIYYLEKVGGDLPTRIEDAMALVLVASLAVVAGYLKAE